MFEGVLAWFFLIGFVVNEEPLFAIASGIFAIAANVYYTRKDR